MITVMQYVVVGLCFALIGLSVFLTVRRLLRPGKNKGCGGFCGSCGLCGEIRREERAPQGEEKDAK
ncbi:MAG: hypothetical protein PHD67_07740 [Oscillospiraceae bacterium]|nr:hypothetical protein [Oscillospiraceae bacterium]